MADRNSYEKIAEQEIGYSHPLGPQVDILLGGGRCYFKPKSDPTSCREDDVDLFGYAESKGFRIMQDRKSFDELEKGTAKVAALPYIGLFNDGKVNDTLLSNPVLTTRRPNDVRNRPQTTTLKRALSP